MASPSNPIVFYDIAQRPPVTESCCAVNPWKSRLALNFKGVPYTTSWVEMPDISKVRSSLNIPPCRKFADGSDFNTLPIIHDPATDSFVGDSFDIAVYLQKTYPSSGAGDLFPSQEFDWVCPADFKMLIPLTEIRGGDYAEYARFNVNVDAAFTAHTGLMAYGMPLDPATAEITKAEFVRRAGVNSWEDFNFAGGVREQMKASFEKTLGDLAKIFQKDTSGPFILGQKVSYADLIVGGWLRMMKVTLPQSEWEDAKAWHGGVFGQLHDALDKYADVV